MIDSEYSFGIYRCVIRDGRSMFLKKRTVVILAVDMNAVIATLANHQVLSIERIDSEITPIIINKKVMRMFEEKSNERSKKK